MSVHDGSYERIVGIDIVMEGLCRLYFCFVCFLGKWVDGLCAYVFVYVQPK